MPKAVFRCDASNAIGSGHIYRCLTIAERLSQTGWEIAFAASAESVSVVPLLATKNLLPVDTAEPCDLLIVDHYGLDAGYEQAACAWAGRIAVIDDLADRHHECDVLIDTTFGRKPEDYKPLIPADCLILYGAEYAMLRPQFAQARNQSLERRIYLQNPPRVLVSLGSTNVGNVTGKVLEALRGYPLQIDVVMGPNAPHLEEVQALTSASVTLHTNVSDMAALMSLSDIAIGAGGTSSWERCCLGIPTLLIEVADNQSKIAHELEEAGAIISLGLLEDFDAAKLQNILQTLLQNKTRLRDMSARAAAICDGRGVDRILPALLPPARSKTGTSVNLRPMTEGDETIMLHWQSQKQTREFARTPRAPQADEHAAWMRKTLDDANAHPYIILAKGVEAGHVRLNKRGDVYEVSLLIDPAQYGQGIGAAALELLHFLHGDKTIHAEILPGNTASLALFQKSGYKAINENWYVHERFSHP